MPFFIENSPTAIRRFKADLKKDALCRIHENLNDLNAQFSALKEASSGETKSSAGDKYETGRETIRQSRALLEKQLQTIRQWESKIQQIPLEPVSDIREGAVVLLDLGWIWVSVSFGKLVMQTNEIQGVSVASPLVLAIKGRKKGDVVTFRGRKIEILDIL
ncbi:GreA/GreB family elongation factor [Cyclobacterium salsum]|uniref:GreA/GreB family elongation factor n=1 Tax=Cyclobacterium salsum TaxID=2666329 RepID=UPI001391BFAA|nr:GreA/GreB family elongation factor [Cyclobacterium salsum]